MGKDLPPISLFTYYSLKINFVPFLKSWPATIPCKTIKWATKLLMKKKGFRACVKNKLFNYVRSVGNYAFFLTKFIFSHSYAN